MGTVRCLMCSMLLSALEPSAACTRYAPHRHDWYERVVGFLDKVLKFIASEIVWKYLLEKETFGKIFRDLLPDRGRLNLILYPALWILRARFGYADEKLDGGMM